MKAIEIKSNGGPEVLELVEKNDLVPAKGEVLVDVEAAGINYVDVYHRLGIYPLPLPVTPGLEGVGIIAAVGEGVDRLKKGQRVAWVNVLGSYASQLLVPAAQAIVVPIEITVDEALIFQALTVQYLVTEYRSIKPGDTALVHAAAGGVGQLLVQWLKHLGALVIATVSTEEKAATVKALGADVAINYSHGQFLEEVLRATDGRGIDIVFDSVGKTTLVDSIKALAPRGTVITYGTASGAAPSIDPGLLSAKSARLAAGSLFEYIGNPAELQKRAEEVFTAIEQGWLRVPQGAKYALADAPIAHKDIESRSTQGKLALVP